MVGKFIKDTYFRGCERSERPDAVEQLVQDEAGLSIQDQSEHPVSATCRKSIPFLGTVRC